MTVRLDTEKANQAIKDGTLQKTMQQAMERLKPESAYFVTEDGLRTGYYVFDLPEPSQLPMICEPFFQNLGAKIDYRPAMNFEDVMKGMQEAGF